MTAIGMAVFRRCAKATPTPVSPWKNPVRSCQVVLPGSDGMGGLAIETAAAMPRRASLRLALICDWSPPICPCKLAATLVMRRSLPGAPTDTVFARLAIEPLPSATELGAVADAPAPSARDPAPLALLPNPRAVDPTPDAVDVCPIAVDCVPLASAPVPHCSAPPTGSEHGVGT